MNLLKKIALKATMNKAKELYENGDTVEKIAEKFWANEQVAMGLVQLKVNSDELIKMIKNKVGKK